VLDAVPPHALLRDSILPLPSIPAGVTVSFTRTFTLNSFAGLPDSVKIAFMVDPQNLIAESDETDNIVMSDTKLLSFGEFTWVGGASNAWENPANWSPAAVPHARSNVHIPVASVYPVLSSTTEIAQLTQDAGTSLTINAGFTLTVYGSLINVNVTGAGSIRVAPAASAVSGYAASPPSQVVSGIVARLFVDAPVALAADFRSTARAVIGSAGAVYVGIYTFRVDGLFDVHGILDMTNDAARVVIGENAFFHDGPSMVGHLTAGELHFLAAFQSGGANRFPAAGTHVTVFGGATTGSVIFPGDPGNYFQHVRIEKPGIFTFLTAALVNGTVRINEITPEVISTQNITIGGNLEVLGNTFWRVQSTTFTGDPVFPASMAYGVTFTGNAMLRQPTSIGGLAIAGNGNLDLNGFDLTVGGTFYTNDNATIEMTAGETLDIGANAAFNGGSTQGKLTHGRINFRGPFAAGPALAFAADAVTETAGITTWFMGTDAQTITLDNAHATTGNRFGDLRFANPAGVTLLTDIVVTGNLEMDVVAPLSGPGLTLTAMGNIVDNATCDCNIPEAVAGANGPALTPAQNAAALTGQNYHVTNTVLAGSTQRLPYFIDTNVTVVSNVKLFGVTTIGGNLVVQGNLRLGGALDETCPGTFVLVTGNFATTGSGTLEMLCSQGDFLTLDVDGTVDFLGGSETGRLKHGRLEVGGHFTAGGPTHTSFVSEGTALWLAPYTDQPGQSIWLSFPAVQTFRDVLIRRGGQTGTLNIDFVNGAHVYGHFDVDVPDGAFIHLSSSTGATLNVHGIDTCNDACWYGMFQLYSARIDNMPIVTEHAAVYIQYIVFGTYATNVDQFTMIEVEDSPYFADIQFETVPAAGHYQMRASGTGATIIVNNPTPATEAAGARWLDENGAVIIWGHEPNLTISSVTFPASVTIGETVQLSGLLRNEGVNPAGSFFVRIRVLDAATGLPVTNVPVLNISVPGLGGGTAVAVAQNVTIAASPFIVWPPSIKAEILLDSTGTVAETNEQDNVFITSAVTVNQPPSNVVGAVTQRPANR
jgi:hypothetical protein